MNATSFGVLVAALLFQAGISSAQVICGNPQTSVLKAGQYIDAGDVVIGNDENFVYVTFVSENGWTITETHVAVGDTVAGIPQTKSGSPKIGNFAYQGSHDNVTTVVYAIPLSELGADGCGAIAACAVVEKTTGSRQQEETAWGSGSKFSNRNWSMYMTYCKQNCQPEDT